MMARVMAAVLTFFGAYGVEVPAQARVSGSCKVTLVSKEITNPALKPPVKAP
jgi:hypothetical protein